MEQLLRREVAGRVAVVVVTERNDGDVRPDLVDPVVLHQRQVALTGAAWMMLDEVHGTGVVDIDDLDDSAELSWPIAGTGDVLIAARSDRPLAVWVADCAPIALFATNGTGRVVAHAGWRGLADGVIDVAIDALESSGTEVAIAVLGPSIHACCYEFGADDLEQVAIGVGATPSAITATTAWGTRALDVPAAVRSAFGRRGIALDVVGACTGCDPRFQSHRRRADTERHALVAWSEMAP
jgi:copper oxidase (laccase) domain-containing protein